MRQEASQTILELLTTIVVIWVLAAMVSTVAAKSYKRIKAKVKLIEYQHFAKAMWYYGEPDPKILDPNTGREVYYTTNQAFPGLLFTIDKW